MEIKVQPSDIRFALERLEQAGLKLAPGQIPDKNGDVGIDVLLADVYTEILLACLRKNGECWFPNKAALQKCVNTIAFGETPNP